VAAEAGISAQTVEGWNRNFGSH